MVLGLLFSTEADDIFFENLMLLSLSPKTDNTRLQEFVEP